MASYDHWLSDQGVAFARHVLANPSDRAAHGAFADYLEEHGDPLAAVVRRSPGYADWLRSQTGDPGRFPAGPTSHEGYVIRSHPGYDQPQDDGRSWDTNTFYVHHKVVGAKGQPSGRHSVIAASVNFPGAKSGSVKDRARFVAPVTKDELKAILAFHRGRGDQGMTGGVSGTQAVRRAIRSPAVGEHPGIGDDSLQLAAREEYDAKVAQAKAYRQKILGKLAADPHNRELRGKLADFLDRLQGITGDKEHDAHLARLLRLHTTEVEMSHGTGESSHVGDDLYNFRRFYKDSRGWLTDEEADRIGRLVKEATGANAHAKAANVPVATGANAANFLDRLSQIVPPYHPAYQDVKELAVKERDPRAAGQRTPAFVTHSFGAHPGGQDQYGSYVGGRAIPEVHPQPADAFLYAVRHMNQTGKTGLVVNTQLPHDQNRRYREEAMQKPEAPAQAARADAHPGITAEAREYHEAHRNAFGLDLPPDGPGPRFDPELSRRAAQAFERAKHLPDHPRVREAYTALKQEILAQHTFLEAKGVKMEPWTKEGQPYANSAEMAHDARNNRHLFYFPTQHGYGQGNGEPPAHPLLEPVPGRPGVVYNDLFRAVHDYFGHAMKGHQFGPKGELQAWGEHARMFSPKARLALTAETHGQNSWVNFGPHSDKPVTERPFAEQKATILPKNVVPKMDAEPKQLARGDALLANTGSDEPDPDSITPARIIPRAIPAPVWRPSARGGHLVGLPQADGTTLVRRFASAAEARPSVMKWAATAAPEHRSALVAAMRRVPAEATPAAPKVTLGFSKPPAAGPALPVRKAPKVVDYTPGMEPPVKADRTDTQGSLNHPEALRRVLAGNLDGAKKFLEDLGDPVRHVLDAASRFPADPNTNLAPGPNAVKTYGAGTNHQAAVKLTPAGDLEVHFRQVGADGPRAVGFRKRLDPEALRQVIAYHRAPRPEEPTKLEAGESDGSLSDRWFSPEYRAHIAGIHKADQSLVNKDAMPRLVFADRLEEADDPLAAVVRRSPAYQRWTRGQMVGERPIVSNPSILARIRDPQDPEGKGVMEIYHRAARSPGNPQVGHHVVQVYYHMGDKDGLHKPFVSMSAPVSADELREIARVHGAKRHVTHPSERKAAVESAGFEELQHMPPEDAIHFTRRRQFQGWWLSPKGRLHRTGYVSHDRYARAKFGKSRDEMHADGWHRVARFGGSRLHVLKGGKGLNDHQRKAVKDHADRRELSVGREPEGADAQAARNPAGPSGLAQALQDIRSQRQVVRKQLAARIAQEAGVQLANVIDAASVVPHPRAGIVQQVHHGDRDTMNYAAAWYGMLAREPRLTVFHEGDGNDILHVTNSPLGVSQILETAGQHRLPGVTVSPKGDLHVLDPGGRNTGGVLRFLQDVRAARPNTIRGEAHRIGAASGDPAESRAAYRDVIKNFQGV